MDVTGKLLLSKAVWFDATHRVNDLQLANLAQGIYFLKSFSEGTTPLVIKVVKE
jgi:hypothetical protein